MKGETRHEHYLDPVRRTDRAPTRRRRCALVPRCPRHDQGCGRDNRRPARRARVPLAAGSGSPLHVHHNEDEWFYVIEGELTLWVDGNVIVAPAGSFVYGRATSRTPSSSPRPRPAS